jgi:hypothetical protein
MCRVSVCVQASCVSYVCVCVCVYQASHVCAGNASYCVSGILCVVCVCVCVRHPVRLNVPCVYVCMCARAFMRAGVRACVRACVYVCQVYCQPQPDGRAALSSESGRII